MPIKVRISAKKGAAILRKEKKRIRFVGAYMLTHLAKGYHKESVARVYSIFKIRRPWAKSGKYSFKVRTAKRDDLTSVVFSRAPWLKHHEKRKSNLVKMAKNGGNLIVPDAKIERTSGGKIKQKHRPTTRGGVKKKSFIRRKGKYGKEVIYKKVRNKDKEVGKNGRVNKYKLQLMYVVQKSAMMRVDLGFYSRGKKFFVQNKVKYFREALAFERKTRRR